MRVDICAFSGLLAVLLAVGTPIALAQTSAQKGQRPIAMDRVAELERQVKNLQSWITSLSNRVPTSFASLDCNTKRYDEFRFEGSHLVFFASCTDIEPYLEGHRVRITIGNPYTFNFSNVKGHLGYGKTVIEALTQKVEVSTTETIRGGTWHLLTISVNPSKAEDMRALILELKSEAAGPMR